jgi:hypothetical protein
MMENILIPASALIEKPKTETRLGLVWAMKTRTVARICSGNENPKCDLVTVM